MKNILCTALMLIASLTASAQIERPRLVVGLVVDQMRWDYLYYYYNDYRNGGIRRLLKEGFSCENTKIPYVPTVTAIGHASIYTGTTPALHGICGNHFYLDGQRVYCCDDSTVQTVGSNTKYGKMSPQMMMASTIGDELKIATDYQAKVIGVSIKDRAAILPAGHAANAAYWWDNKAECFISSTFYMQELPQWVQKFNKKHKGFVDGEPILSPKGVTLTFEMAAAIVENEKMGQDDITDLLTISISSTDGIGHKFSTRGPENKAAYMTLDQGLEQFFKLLDKKVGAGNWLLFLSADHGAAQNYNQMKEHHIPAGGFENWKQIKPLHEYLQQKFQTTENLLIGTNSYRIYLDRENIRKLGLSLDDVKREAIDWLRQDERYEYVVDFERAQEATLPAMLREQLCNGYNYHRSGDIALICRPQVLLTEDSPAYKGTTHGAWNPYDAHIPCVFMGWHIQPGQTNVPTYMTDIAPTVCALLHIEAPNACIGTPITAITK